MRFWIAFVERHQDVSFFAKVRNIYTQDKNEMMRCIESIFEN